MMKSRRKSLWMIIMSILISLHGRAQDGWKELGSGNAFLNPNAHFLNTATDHAGNVYGAGLFTNASGYKYVAKWDGTSWQEVGTGANTLKANDAILSIKVDLQGNIYAAGYFTNAMGYSYVAKWDGSSWTELGTGLNSKTAIFSIAIDAKGTVYAAGDNVFKWDGSNWIQLGTGTNSLKIKYWPIRSIISDASGNLYAAGQFSYSNGIASVAKWDGISWSELGSGANALNANGTIASLAIDAANNIYAGGSFSNTPGGQGYVAKWDGASWSEVGTGANSLNANGQTPGAINSLAIDSKNNIYTAGSFIGANGYRYVSKWDGTKWSELGAGCYALNANLDIISISVSENDNIYAAGVFRNINGNPYIAQYIRSGMPPQPTPTFTQIAPICAGGSLNPLPTKSLENFSGTWSPALNNTKTTTYTFTPGPNQCASIATMTIPVNAPTKVPTFSQVIPVCSGSSLSPLPRTSLEGISGTWSPALNNTATTLYTFTPLPGQCASTATMTIEITSKIKPTFYPIEPICSGALVNPLPSTSIENIKGSWSPAFNNTETTSYLFTPSGTGQCATTANTIVTVKPVPPIVFSTADTLIPPNTPITLTPIITGSVSSFLWSPSTFLNNTVTQYPVSTPQNDIDYTITAFYTNGCSAKNKFSIVINRALLLPSAFTPNGDGKNDIFQIPPSCRFVKVNEFSVFDRYGKKVFNTRNVAMGWDGKINSLPQNAGTYVWYINYNDPILGKPVIQKGTVVLIR
ncbi:T9SS type B sorting domain-containing protein [Flavisolibacter ginsengisoli]|jgi:gliding motility-associated-like protein|uniref:Gliding motility-associated C-terminal domain-containing protein n=1 Tax=Flavisolibacter ginsengisoli DSM 18119 TaxID=1121884 RepID=A0A1M5EN08_9BACT|nr:gliding motility-associated C-terminal domain-containing protein [Flavisolibacter ginsengisoli]SHF80678.1 gliding motility-associated C-terminal domain-containing protein [Flavisolibacter ginsengisoli DSM 18119]